jgi:cholesterol 7-dehydrogenase
MVFFCGVMALGFLFSVALVDEEYRSKFVHDNRLMEIFAEVEPYRNYILAISALLMVAIVLNKKLSQETVVVNHPDSKEKIPNGKLLARAARSRSSGKIPPAYPTGWYKVEYSRSLRVGDVRYIEFLGEHLVLFRGETGKAAVLDAYCPHLGANLSVEGKVVGDCIECPFHGWQFNNDGKCTHIPYTDKVPEIAKTRSWPTVEKNDAIYMFYDALGREPTWHLPDITEIYEMGYKAHGSFENYVEAHIQEIPENGSDVAHLGVLHVPFALDKWLPCISHKWTAEWKAGEAPEDHIAHIKLSQTLRLFGKELDFTKACVSIRQIGPGVVYLVIETSFGRFVIAEHVTPMQPLFQKVTHTIFGTPNLLSKLVGHILLYSFCEQFNRDVVIWNNKKYIHKPIIVKNDGNILGFRRWYSKFYPPETAENDKIPGKQDLSW